MKEVIFMLRIAICDDDRLVAANLESLIERITQKYLLQCSIEVFYDGSTLKQYSEQGNKFDIIYLDIEMTKMSGIEAAKYIRDFDKDVVFIFVSGYESYFIELFEAEPFRFIKKPVDESVFEDVFQKAYQKIVGENVYFSYRYNKMDYKVRVNDIVYFESDKRTVMVVLKNNDTVKFYGKLDNVEKMLSYGKIPFLRIHQSYLINFNYIVSIGYKKVIVGKNVELQISEERQKRIRTSYLNILREEVMEKYDL